MLVKQVFACFITHACKSRQCADLGGLGLVSLPRYRSELSERSVYRPARTPLQAFLNVLCYQSLFWQEPSDLYVYNIQGYVQGRRCISIFHHISVTTTTVVLYVLSMKMTIKLGISTFQTHICIEFLEVPISLRL